MWPLEAALATEINIDLGCDIDMVLGSSLGLDVTTIPGGSIGHPDQHAHYTAAVLEHQHGHIWPRHLSSTVFNGLRRHR